MKSPFVAKDALIQDALMRRSQTFHKQMKSAGVESISFDTLFSTLRLEEEQRATVKDLAAKRFLDLLHLNSTS